jgi:hypothetical protein
MKVTQWCKDGECDKQPTEVIKIGNKKYKFCCQKGFENSLKEFCDFINKPEK